MTHAPLGRDTERVGSVVIGAAIEVHRHLGPAFLERIYADALCIELTARGVPFERERTVAVVYKGISIPGQRIDLIVANQVVVELKALGRLDALHQAKVMSYLRSANLRLGLILNFNLRTMKEGISRIVI